MPPNGAAVYVFIYIIAKLQNCLTDHHENWHVYVIFHGNLFLCYPYYCKSPLDNAAVINLYIIQLIYMKIDIYLDIQVWEIFLLSLCYLPSDSAAAFHLLYCSTDCHENWYGYVSEHWECTFAICKVTKRNNFSVILSSMYPFFLRQNII